MDTIETGRTCADCGTVILREAGRIGAGYATDDNGLFICYSCCAEQDRRHMIETGRHTGLYLTKRDGKWQVTNWPGTLKFSVPFTSHSKRGGGFGSQRTDAWFRGPDGFIWHAICRGDMDLARARRTKRTSF